MNRSAIIQQLENKGLKCFPDDSIDDLKETLAAWNAIENSDFNLASLTDMMLLRILRALGINPGPIGPTTRGVYESKLQRILEKNKSANNSQSAETKSSFGVATSTPKFDKMSQASSPYKNQVTSTIESTSKADSCDIKNESEMKSKYHSEIMNSPPKVSRRFFPERSYRNIPIVLNPSMEAPFSSSWKESAAETRTHFQDSTMLSSVKSTPSAAASSKEWMSSPPAAASNVNVRKRDPLKRIITNESDLETDFTEKHSSSSSGTMWQCIAIVIVGVLILFLFVMFETNPRPPIPL